MEVLLCIYGLDSLLPDVKAMKKFKENLACRLINFCNTLNQAWCKLLNSLMVLSNTFSLMSLQNSLPYCIIKDTKRSVINWNINIFWPKFTLLQQLLMYSTDFYSCVVPKGWIVNPYIAFRISVTNFVNNEKIS